MLKLQCSKGKFGKMGKHGYNLVIMLLKT